MKKIFVSAMIASTATLAACSAGTPKHTLTPLEIQSMQSRSYEANKDVVFPSVVSVFQDLGYTITQGDMDTGLITAESATQNNATMTALFGVSSTKQTGATAFVETIGEETKVRLNFVEKNMTSSAYGRNDRKDTPIMEAEVYQNAFERIENAIFVREG